MSKELEALETLKNMLIGNGVNDNINDYVDNLILPIKQALHRLEAIDNSNPSEALEHFINYCENHTTGYTNDTDREDMEYVQQALLKAQEQELNNGGRLPNKEVLYLKQSLEQCNDKPIFYVSRTYGNKYIVQQKFLDDLTKENARNEEILQKYYQEGITLDSVRALKKEMAELKGQVPEPKQYLKWEDLEFKGEEQTMKVILNGSVHFLSYYRNMFGDNLCMIDNTGITIWKENKQFFNDLHLERVEE